MVRRLARHALVGSVVLLTPACLSDSEPADEHRGLQFLSLVVPSQIGLGDPLEVEVSYLVGPSGCWELERLDLALEDHMVRIEGSAVRPGSREGCADIVLYGKEHLMSPPLPVGAHRVVAGALDATVTVVDQDPVLLETLVYRGTVHVYDSGCALEGHSALVVGFSGLPLGLSGGEEYLVRGVVVQEDPCIWPGALGWVDHFVVVSDVELIGE
jgi:hypothetical protein